MPSTDSIATKVWPNRSLVHNTLLVVGGSAVLALLSQVEVPIGPVPITLQTLGVLLIGALYGPRLGMLTIGAYLAEGAAGLPVFAGGAGGWLVLVGPTAGYLWGFLLVVAVVGWITEQDRFDRVIRTAVAMVLGSVVVYVPGLVVLNQFVSPWEATVAAGLVPFLLGDALKLALAFAIVTGASRLLPPTRDRSGSQSP